jgi:hypothetical protein
MLKDVAVARWQAAGLTRQYVPALLVVHARPWPLLPFLRSRFQQGRCFAGHPCALLSSGERILHALAFPLVALVLGVRLAHALWPKRHAHWAALSAAPLVLLFLPPGRLARRSAIFSGLAQAASGASAESQQFWLQGFVWERSVAEWQAVCFQVPGPETAALGAIAGRCGGVSRWRRVRSRPGLAWPLVHHGAPREPSRRGGAAARKFHSSNILGQLPDRSPGDVLAAYGTADLFRVTSTPYGRLAVTASSDLSWPEVARGFRLAGAEILLQAAGSLHTPQATVADLVCQARARENGMVIASAN